MMLGKSSADRLLRPEGRVGKLFPALLIELEALDVELDVELCKADKEDLRLWTSFSKSLTLETLFSKSLTLD